MGTETPTIKQLYPDTVLPEELPDGVLTELSSEELWGTFDRQSRTMLGISGKEFERRWVRGDYTAGLEREEDPRVMTVLLSMPSYSSIEAALVRNAMV